MYRSRRKIEDGLTKYTKLMALATLFLFFAACLSAYATIQISDSNEKMTDITKEFYRYHLPEVSLIEGYVGKLYVFRDNKSGSFFTVIGFASVYNSAQSDDIALARQKYLGKSYKPFENTKITIYGVQDNSMIEIYEIDIENNDTISIEGNPSPIAIIPGEPPIDIPLMMTYKSEDDINLNKTVEFEIVEEISIIEVIHPINKTILANITTLKPTNITYIMGKDSAIVRNSDGRTYNIDVRYTENEDTYRDWKRIFLRPYGISSFIV